MTRWLGWFGLGILILGVFAAFLARLWLAARVLQFGFGADPAVTILVVTVLLGLVLLSISAYSHWQITRTQRALAAQAESLETERRRFIQRLDHELKNPLTAIQVQLDNLQELGGDDAQAIAHLREQADRLAAITRGLRRLADLETRQLEIERVDIGELLEEVVELLQAPARITLDVQRIPWSIPPINGDRELLLIVFRNLVDNALKYSTAPVQVHARHTAGALIVEVVDAGRGIAPHELPFVAEEFYRGVNTRDVAGAGLGLSIVKRILERHGGKLDLLSRPGQGTIAAVQLPYDQTR